MEKIKNCNDKKNYFLPHIQLVFCVVIFTQLNYSLTLGFELTMYQSNCAIDSYSIEDSDSTEKNVMLWNFAKTTFIEPWQTHFEVLRHQNGKTKTLFSIYSYFCSKFKTSCLRYFKRLFASYNKKNNDKSGLHIV